MYDINYERIPENMREEVRQYIENGIINGDFLYSVLTNNFVDTCCFADDINRKHLVDWAYFLYDELPRECWGSNIKILEWIRKKRK